MEASKRPKIPEHIVRKILIESGHRCAVCGASCPLERAHIIPWSEVKEHVAENLIMLCANCHERADKEHWGEKVLGEYKARPWIVRNGHAEPSVSTPRKQVEVTLVLDWETYDENHEKLLIAGLSSFLRIPPDQIKVRARKKGSVKLTLSIPASKADELIQSFAARDHDLFLFLNQYRALEIVDLGIEGGGDYVKVNKLSSDMSYRPGGVKLYVGNLSFKTTENDIRALFSKFGAVTDVYVAMDKFTGRPRGFAFVTMALFHEAKHALEKLHGTDFQGRRLTVTDSRRKQDRSSGLNEGEDEGLGGRLS